MLKATIKMTAWEVVNPALLKMCRKRKHVWLSEWQGLNLGCGLDVLDAWVGIDGGLYVLLKRLPSTVLRLAFRSLNISDMYTYTQFCRKLKSANVIYHDLKYNIPFKTETCPYIYSSHFLEHLAPQEAEKLIKECYRVLQFGGGIRVVVPSLKYEVSKMQIALNQYEQGNSQPVMEYFVTSRPGYTDPYSVHRYMYDYSELRRLLASVGFVNIEECAYKTGRMKDCEKLDTRENSLFVEAWKI